MKILLCEKLFRSGIYILLLLPLISLLTYIFGGVFFNFNSLFFIVYILFLLLFIITIKNIKFLLLFCLINALTLAIHIKNLGGAGLVEYLRTFSSYYSFVVIGWLLFFFYYKNNKLSKLYTLLIKIGVFIAVINLVHYIWMVTDNYHVEGWSMSFDNYSVVIEYIAELNKAFYDYILIGYNYDNLLRPIGYFYDTHSQYYLPLIAGTILLTTKEHIDITKSKKTLYLLIIASSILMSGIKTAIFTIIGLILVYIYFNVNRKTLISYVKKFVIVIPIIVYVFKNQIMNMLFSENAKKIIIQLIEMVLTLPNMIISTDPLVFIAGGAPYLRDEENFYSEIFWISIIFYIGLIGIFVYLWPLAKSWQLTKQKVNSEAIYIYVVFFLSMMHYSVYKVGINNIATALIFMYYFAYIRYKKMFYLTNNI